MLFVILTKRIIINSILLIKCQAFFVEQLNYWTKKAICAIIISVLKKDLTMKLGDKIKKMRKDRKWSQADLADKLSIHVTHVSRIETERFTPSLDLLKKLAEVFEVTTDYLIYEDMENVGPINLKDKTLFEKMKLVDDLEEKDRSIIHGVIDAFLVKKQMWKVLNSQLNINLG